MKSKKVRVVTPDGIPLAVVTEEPEGQYRGVAILAHGITVEKDEGGFYSNLSKELTADGIRTIRFDFRGHGESGGFSNEMTIAGEITDLTTVIEFARKRFGGPIAIVATSFGASIALLYAALKTTSVKTYVLLCPVIDYSRTFLKPVTPWGKKEFGPKRLEIARKRGFLSVGGFRLGTKLFTEFMFYKPGEILAELSIPTLLVHGTKDSMVPFAVSKAYTRKARNCRFLPIPGADHGFEGYETYVYGQIRRWLSGHLAQ